VPTSSSKATRKTKGRGKKSPDTNKNSRPRRSHFQIPTQTNETTVQAQGGEVRLTNLAKTFWPKLKLTKRDLLQYYADVSPWLLPHLRDRAMVMKRYPNGISGEFFFMKRVPDVRPEWIPTCPIEHHSGNVIEFPVAQNLATLLWIVNLGCVDLNPWYSRCDDVDRPDYLHFDLDPVDGASFRLVRETALAVRDALEEIRITSYPKTTGSRGIHVYVPIVRGPSQKQVWSFAKALSIELARRHPKLITAEYRVAKRPRGHVLVDYNQNAWNRTLASVYSVRPKPEATVSAPITWEELEQGVELGDFTMMSLPARLSKVGDLWKPLLEKSGRTDLSNFA